MKRRWVAGACAFIALMGACSSFTGGEDHTVPSPNDAGGSPEADGSPTPEAGQIVVTPGDAAPTSCPFTASKAADDVVFEDFGATGCDGWGPNNATVERVLTDCGYACRVCNSTGAAGDDNISKSFAFSAADGTYALTAWLRSDDASDAGVGDMASFRVDVIYSDDHGDTLPISNSQTGGFAASWSETTSPSTGAGTGTGAASALVYIDGKGVAPNGCFLVANVHLTRTP